MKPISVLFGGLASHEANAQGAQGPDPILTIRQQYVAIIPKKENAPFATVLYDAEIFDHIAFFLRHHYGKDSELCYWSGALQTTEGSPRAGLPSRKAIKILGESRDLRVLDSLLKHRIFAAGLEDAIAGLGRPQSTP